MNRVRKQIGVALMESRNVWVYDDANLYSCYTK